MTYRQQFITSALLQTYLILLAYLAIPRGLASQDFISLKDDVAANHNTPGTAIAENTDTYHSFSLRHVLHHGVHKYPALVRKLDIQPTDFDAGWFQSMLAPPSYTAKSCVKSIKRLEDRRPETINNYLYHSRRKTLHLQPMVWKDELISAPDIEDRETILTLARMTANAYVETPKTADWEDIGEKWNSSTPFGWEEDGIRGHVFVDNANTTIVLSIKGTTVALWDGAGTTTRDKTNDNLLFSCCCARVSALWKTVCDCYTGTYSCSNVCLKRAIIAEDQYYRAVLNLYTNVTQMYPDKQIWAVGHSLGGSFSSLLGQTYNLPVVTFEAPGELLASQRIGIWQPPQTSDSSNHAVAYHFGHNADPLYLGTCNGPGSFCSLWGYAMETKCHSGYRCEYDVVGEKGWRPGLQHHRIHVVIDSIIKKYDQPAKCVLEDEDCIDCFNWNFHNNDTKKSTTTTTSTSTKPIKTRTSTCQHPGWWGCLDETTTVTVSSSTTTTTTMTNSFWTSAETESSYPSMTTSTCLTPGFFWGCRDTATMTIVTTTTIVSSLSSSIGKRG